MPGVDKAGCDDVAEGELGCAFRTAGCELNFAPLPATFGVRRNRNPDPNLARPYQLVCNAGISRELRPGLGVSANYYRRRFDDITFTTDLAKPFSVYTRTRFDDPRGNGQKMTVYNLDPAALRNLNELDTTSASNTSTFHSVDVGVNAAVPATASMLSGGTATGRSRDGRPATSPIRTPPGCASDYDQFDVPLPDDLQDVGPVPAAVGHPVERRLPVDGRRSHQPNVHPDSGGLSGPDRRSADGVFDHRAAPQRIRAASTRTASTSWTSPSPRRSSRVGFG